MKAHKALDALRALAQESRLSVYRLLLDYGKDGLSAGDISEQLSIPATTMSFHLSQLRHAGLVESYKNGRSIIYSANKKKAKKLANYITGKKGKDEDDKYQL